MDISENIRIYSNIKLKNIRKFWPVIHNGENIGKITSAVYSPRLKKNIALGIINIEYSKLNTELSTEIDNQYVKCSK